MNSVLVCVDGDWSVVLGRVNCTGTIEQIIQTVPTQITYLALAESFAEGFGLCVPVIAVIFGARLLLSMIR